MLGGIRGHGIVNHSNVTTGGTLEILEPLARKLTCQMGSDEDASMNDTAIMPEEGKKLLHWF